MATFPTLSFACPVDWNSMRGDERERFCAKCARTVVNLSALTEEQRRALLAAAKPGELCVAYYRRLSGEFVTAERPLTDPERRRARQYGLASLSAAALALSASCVSKNTDAIALAGLTAAEAYLEAREEAAELRDKVVAKLTRKPPPPKRGLIMFAGMMVCPPPTAAPTAPIPVEVAPAETSATAEAPQTGGERATRT